MKRGWIGFALMVLLLAGSGFSAWTMARQHIPLGQCMEQAAEAALSEDWETAEALAEQTGVRWVQHRKRAAAFADHEPMEEIDALFAQLEVYRSAQDAVSFAAVCKLLSCQLQALGDAHIPTWWNLL